MTRALIFALVLAGCSSGPPGPSGSSGTPATPPPPSPPPAPPSSPEVTMPPAPPPSPTCTTEADVRAHLNTVCTVVGIYDLRDIPNKKGRPWRTWPVVTLDGTGFVALESVWDETKMPAPDEVERWRGKKVAVTGTVLPQPPSKTPANMAMLTIAPVERIALAP
jgi:hypothetical protein